MAEQIVTFWVAGVTSTSRTPYELVFEYWLSRRGIETETGEILPFIPVSGTVRLDGTIHPILGGTYADLGNFEPPLPQFRPRGDDIVFHGKDYAADEALDLVRIWMINPDFTAIGPDDLIREDVDFFDFSSILGHMSVPGSGLEGIESRDFTVWSLEVGPEPDVPVGPDEARTVALVYETVLDRDGEIDAAGLNFWIDSREEVLSERAMAAHFLTSGEFDGQAGPVEALEDEELVRLFYRNALEREAEAEGLAFWLDALEGPFFDEMELALAFATSPEAIEVNGYVATLTEGEDGIWGFA